MGSYTDCACGPNDYNSVHAKHVSGGGRLRDAAGPGVGARPADNLCAHTYNNAMRSRPQLLSLLVTVALVVIILILFITLVDVRAVWEAVRRANGLYLLGGTAALVAGLAAYATRWRLLLADKPRWRSTFDAANVGHAVNTLIPLRAGEPARILVLGRMDQTPLAEITSSVVVERLFEQIMRLTALAGAVLFGAGLKLSPGAAVGGVGMVVVVFAGLWWLIRNQAIVIERWPRALARLPRVTEAGARRTLTHLLAGLSSVSSPRRLALAFIWSVVAWGCFLVFHILILLALPDVPSAQRLAIALGALALVPPSAPTLPGLYHGSLVGPLSAVGFDGTLLTSYAVLLHLIQLLLMVGLGGWGFWRSGIKLGELRPRPKAQATDIK